MNFAIIDIQGFKHKSNEFIVKELCVYTDKLYFHDVVKSPYSFNNLTYEDRKQTRWLFRNFHGLLWDDGNISTSQASEIITPQLIDKVILVKGEEKVKWVKILLNNDNLNVLNVENIGLCAPLKSMNMITPCHFHKQKSNVTTLYHCALQNVMNIQKWYMEIYKVDQS